jgi:hypothetical protein
MSQNLQVSSRPVGEKLTFRIVGRKKKYAIAKTVGETRESLDRRITEAINND